jgi:hypothetical protein
MRKNRAIVRQYSCKRRNIPFQLRQFHSQGMILEIAYEVTKIRDTRGPSRLIEPPTRSIPTNGSFPIGIRCHICLMYVDMEIGDVASSREMSGSSGWGSDADSVVEPAYRLDKKCATPCSLYLRLRVSTFRHQVYLTSIDTRTKKSDGRCLWKHCANRGLSPG